MLSLLNPSANMLTPAGRSAGPQYSQHVNVCTRNICIEAICVLQFEEQEGGRTLLAVTCAVLCCGVVRCESPCVIGGTLYVCLCVYLVATRAHPNTSGPAAAAELILAQDVRTPQFP